MIRLWQNVRSTRIVVQFFLAIFLVFSMSLSAQPDTAPAAAPIDGKALFKANCSSCHNASEVKSTGPGLKGVLGRIPGGDWKYDWVHNSGKLIASGDAYGVKLLAQYKTAMNPFPQLSNEQIDAILAYADTGDGPKGPTGPKIEEKVVKEDSIPVFLIIIVLILLIVLIAILRYTKINLRNAALEKEGLPEEPSRPFLAAARHWMAHHKSKIALIGIFIFSVLTVKTWYALKGIGVYAEEVHPNEWVGYHPSQPINFSHKIHAGDNAIQCQYCHSGVDKSKTAGIPSPNVCMNCHKVIRETVNEGSKEEIAKIYFAVGWNADSAKYTGQEHPIMWNKVHNLPDHVFFSHQQHIVVGKVECAECHGDVKKMTTVEQQRPLTMGWCIECHRTTPVKMAGNGYYDELHEKMKEKYKDQPITVAMAGGIECGRCHY
ncbi:MAG: c-type cytochrome [Bacteroidota bacterium]|nr:c-type cytochrome [Bacteroidota bacterium]